MIYAPVLISTESRFTHFKNCIESLSQCTWADRTVVYVAVDYPACDSHNEGHGRIKSYLDGCGDLGFKALHVIYRETNYFYARKGNLSALRTQVFREYDRIIVTEDDNVFAPNFLVYMDSALEKFEKDDTVLAINGYRHFYPIVYSQNSFFRQNVDFSAWGYGTWRDRYLRYFEGISPDYFLDKLSLKTCLLLKRNGINRLIDYLCECIKRESRLTDNTLSVVMPLEGLDVIMPVFSCVRNVGWDNSGIHCDASDEELAERHLSQELSTDRYFIFVGTGREYYENIKKTYVKYSYARKTIVDLLLFIFPFSLRLTKCLVLRCMRGQSKC